MVGREDLGSWLEGPRRSGGETVPGARLGLPVEGPGSVAPFGRRLAALVVDWLLCAVIAHAFVSSAWWGPLVVFAIEQLLLVATIGFSFGHRLLGIRVIRVPSGAADPGRVALRTALLVLAVPALIWDRDGRGLHDKAAGTIVVLI